MQLRKYAAKTESSFDDFVVLQINKTVLPFLKLIIVFLSSGYLTLNSSVEEWINTGSLAIATYFSLKLGTSLSNYIIKRSLQGQENIDTKIKPARGLPLFSTLKYGLQDCFFL